VILRAGKRSVNNEKSVFDLGKKFDNFFNSLFQFFSGSEAAICAAPVNGLPQVVVTDQNEMYLRPSLLLPLEDI